MDALWVIIFIGALIYRFLNKAGEVKGRLPEGWGENKLPDGWEENKLPPILRDWGFPWEEEPEEDENPAWDEGKSTPKPAVEAPQVKIALAGDDGRQPFGNYQEESPANHMGDKKDAAVDKLPLFDSSNLINGLILSEILGPPRSKRN